MAHPSLRRLFIGGLIALLCAQVLYGALMLSALYKQYEKPNVTVNGLLCTDIADHLSLFIRVGKSLRPQTVAHFLEPYQARTEAVNLAVTDTGGNVIGQTDENAPSRIAIPAEAQTVFGSLKRFSDEKHIWTTAPVLDRAGTTQGHVFLALDKSRIVASVMETAKPHLWTLIALTLGECILLALLLRFMTTGHNAGPSTSGRLRWCFMLPLILGQCLFLALLHTPLTENYQQEMYQTGRQLSRQLLWDLERIAGMGLPVSHIQSMNDWLKVRQQYAGTLGMAVYDENGRLHSAASASSKLEKEAWQDMRYTDSVIIRDIINPATHEFAGGVFVAMDPNTVSQSLRSVMLDNLTLTVIAALFLSELIFLLLMGGGPAASLASSPRFMRPIIFACLFATEMSTSYVPIRIGELGLDLFGLPPALVSGLPVSCELFMAGAAMLIGGFWSQRSGWRPMLLGGIIMAGSGAALGWLAPAPLPFILSRGLAGAGYGFINLAAQVFVIAHSSDKNRATNLAFMFTGLYAGTLCGSAMGGLIADRLGYQAVFAVTALMLAVLALLLYCVLPRERWVREKRTHSFSLREAAAFFFDKRMGTLLLFFIIPNSLITVCLFQFFIPLSLSSAGASAAAIGRVFLVYCVIVMFAGPAFGRFIDRTLRMEIPLFVSLLIACLSLLVPALFDGVPAAILCVALLAVNTAIASNGQGAYALSLPAARRFGHAQTMGFYNVTMRIGQVLGPLSLGLMMSAWDERSGLMALAVLVAACALLFFVFSRGASSSGGTD